MLYRFVNLQKDVNMLILIGDAPPNQIDKARRIDEVQEKRGDRKWIDFMRNNPKSKDELYKVTNCTE